VADTIPDVITPASLADYLEVMTRAVFQAGVRWQQIAEHWDAYQEAFAGFEPSRVALFDELDVERILQRPGIMRTSRKVRATIGNAVALLQTDQMNVWYVLFRTGEPVPRFEEWIVTIPGMHPRMREMVERAREAGRSPERLG
jgi:3-methyladenine DNA glycosylase Tag